MLKLTENCTIVEHKPLGWLAYSYSTKIGEVWLDTKQIKITAKRYTATTQKHKSKIIAHFKSIYPDFSVIYYS